MGAPPEKGCVSEAVLLYERADGFRAKGHSLEWISSQGAWMDICL